MVDHTDTLPVATHTPLVNISRLPTITSGASASDVWWPDDHAGSCQQSAAASKYLITQLAAGDYQRMLVGDD